MSNNELKLAKTCNNNVVQVSNSILIHLAKIVREYVAESYLNKNEMTDMLVECRRIKNTIMDDVGLEIDDLEQFILDILGDSNIITIEN